MITLTIPTPPSDCAKCGRPLGGVMSSPFWPWDVPVLNHVPGKWTCSMCAEGGFDDVSKRHLPAASLKSLNKYNVLDWSPAPDSKKLSEIG